LNLIVLAADASPNRTAAKTKKNFADSMVGHTKGVVVAKMQDLQDSQEVGTICPKCI
jgi:hypothetical protein